MDLYRIILELVQEQEIAFKGSSNLSRMRVAAITPPFRANVAAGKRWIAPPGKKFPSA